MTKFKIILSILIFATWGPTASAVESVTFPLKKIKLKSKVITVEVAKTPKQRERGLMYRESLKENQGMLFVFDQDNILTFWMKNTKISLSVAFFDKKKKLVHIEDMDPPESVMMLDQNLKRYSSLEPAKYALEMKKGWFKHNKIQIGDAFEWVQ
ncbi:MAG: DUF192 domain-containing protein [Bdellovibrionales bacterium]|nr:DUF192 domain-containing protein [Bdellovibrionales bacterium]